MITQFDCIKLHFKAPLHLSKGKDHFDQSAQSLHSDTLASALFSAAIRLGATEDEISEMLDSVRLSSAFPFWKDEYFFPRLKSRVPFEITDIALEKQGKPFKKIQYLGKSWFEKYLNGEDAAISSVEHLKNPTLLSEKNPINLVKSVVSQRVNISPEGSEAPVPYYSERLFFGPESGYFVLAQWEKLEKKSLFQQAFRMLGDLGIGTDRSVGNGFFEPEFSTLSLRLPINARYQSNLGLYLPKEGELTQNDLENSSWALQKRGGFIAGASNTTHMTLRKRSVYMFETGSVFPCKMLTGKRVNLKPNWGDLQHPVWREGRPIFIPINLK